MRSKQPSVKRKLTFDFSAELDGGDTLTGAPTLTPEAGLNVSGPVMVTPLVTCLVNGGVLGTTYKLTCVVNTAQGQILERDVLIRVVEEN